MMRHAAPRPPPPTHTHNPPTLDRVWSNRALREYQTTGPSGTYDLRRPSNERERERESQRERERERDVGERMDWKQIIQ